MLKKLILASATAAVALTAVADFSAEAQNAPTRKPTAGTIDPQSGPGGLQSNLLTDLFLTPLFPPGNEGQPGQFYCASAPGVNQKSNAVSAVVNSQGSKTPGMVEVIFEFSGGKKVRKKVVLNSPNDQKGVAAYIPDNAWNGGKVGFTIRVDYQNKIPETNENNNVVQSFCLDPSI
jgi:hypothetical protein